MEESKMDKEKIKELVREWSKPLRRYLSLTEKEIKTLLNDRMAMIIVFLIPMIVIVLLVYGVSDPGIQREQSSDEPMVVDESPISKSEIPIIGIIDQDSSDGFVGRDLSQEFVDKFVNASEQGRCILYIQTNQSQLEYMIGIGEIDAYLIVPPMFEFNLSIHIPVIIPFVIDAIKTLKLQPVQNLVDEVVFEFKQENNFTGVFKSIKYNENLPEQAQILFIAAPFLFPLLLFGIGCLTATQCVVDDIPKDRMVLTPTNKMEILLAKVSGNQAMLTVLLLFIMIFAIANNFAFRSTILEFFLTLFIIALNAVILGVLISTLADTPLAALQYFIFMFLFQAIIILFVEDPLILSWMPIYNSREVFMKVVLRGQSFWSVREHLGNIIYQSIVLYTASYILFKRQPNLL